MRNRTEDLPAKIERGGPNRGKEEARQESREAGSIQGRQAGKEKVGRGRSKEDGVGTLVIQKEMTGEKTTKKREGAYEAK